MQKNDSDGSSSYLTTNVLKKSSSQWEESSQSTDNVIVVDGASSYHGSDVVSETTIKQLGASSRGGFSKLKYKQKAHVIVDDYQSQGYGMDSEMDAQDLLNEIGEDNNVFVEGDSDIIDEDAEESFEQIRKTKAKKPKSLDDFDGEEEEEQEDFFKDILADRLMTAGDGAKNSRK